MPFAYWSAPRVARVGSRVTSKLHLNGASRNIVKLGAEGKKVALALWWGLRDLFTGGTGHGILGDLVDLPVEAIRASPYFWGHVVILWGVVELGYFIYGLI